MQLGDSEEMRQGRPVSRAPGQSQNFADRHASKTSPVPSQRSRHISDLQGETFGRWFVLEPSPRRAKDRYWWCVCECGTIREVRAGALKVGATKSCGCLAADLCGDRFRTHGHRGVGNARTREYIAWIGAKERCENPNSPAWKNYGGRGIRIAPEWRTDYPRFLADMGPCPPGLTLDRIDVDGDYEPGNCRWATWSEQAKNKRPMTAEHRRNVGAGLRRSWEGVSLSDKIARVSPMLAVQGRRMRPR